MANDENEQPEAGTTEEAGTQGDGSQASAETSESPADEKTE